ncbi:MAG TPA: hypothetical protein VN132_10375, partial [Bdellovibrio sp.]|nr:hypothetical protein [Bdellovibrio sp.]
YFQVNKKNYVEALKIERVHYAKAALKPCSSGHTTSLLALLHLFQDTNNKSEFDKYWAIAKQCENSPNFEPKGQVFVLNSHGSVNLEYKNGPPAQAQMNPPIPAPQPPLGKGKKPKRVVAIIKFATKQCSEFWPGDECISYKVPDGWVIPGGFQLGPGEDPKKFCREMFYTKVTPMINPDFKPDPSCK